VAGPGATRALTLNAPAVVIEVGHVAQVDFKLAAQLFLESRGLGLKLFAPLLPLDLGPLGGLFSVCFRFASLCGPIMVRLCVLHGAVSSLFAQISLWGDQP